MAGETEVGDDGQQNRERLDDERVHLLEREQARGMG